MAQSDQPRDPDLVRIARERRLTYPIATKAEFVAAMTASEGFVTFRDRAYPAEFAARLIPDFFFPIRDEQDLVSKAGELLVARGLSPLPGPDAREETR